MKLVPVTLTEARRYIAEHHTHPSRPRQDETLFGPRNRPAGPKARWVRYLVKEH